MPFIKTVELDEAEGQLKTLYDEIVQQRGGRLPRAFKSASLHPEAVRAVRDLSFAVTFGASSLGRRREELIATFVSWINECDYWMVHHGEFLRAASKDDHLVYHIERDWQQAPITADERAMLAFAHKLTLQPGKIAQADVDALRAAGCDDRGVLDVILITSLFAFMNRLLDGVGYGAEDAFRQAKERGDARVEAELAEAGAQGKPKAAAGD